jgi:uncharacterized 2Fe-2S/4Fe-4S cluster protein (DUF4445 family)
LRLQYHQIAIHGPFLNGSKVKHFVEAMAMPHKTADFVNLKKVVTLPPHKDVVTLGDDGGARRVRRRG